MISEFGESLAELVKIIKIDVEKPWVCTVYKKLAINQLYYRNDKFLITYLRPKWQDRDRCYSIFLSLYSLWALAQQLIWWCFIKVHFFPRTWNWLDAIERSVGYCERKASLIFWEHC